MDDTQNPHAGIINSWKERVAHEAEDFPNAPDIPERMLRNLLETFPGLKTDIQSQAGFLYHITEVGWNILAGDERGFTTAREGLVAFFTPDILEKAGTNYAGPGDPQEIAEGIIDLIYHDLGFENAPEQADGTYLDAKPSADSGEFVRFDHRQNVLRSKPHTRAKG